MSAVTAALLKERDQAYAERDLHIRAGELMAQEIEKLEAHIDATDAAWCARVAALTAQVEAAFCEGFAEGCDGTWIEGDYTPAWNKSKSRAAITEEPK